MDVTQDTVTSATLFSGETATGADGNPVVGSYVPGGGGAPVEVKDVNFIDYDGTVLYSYTKAEALALNALPSNPSHTGLTAQGWNYTLAEMKAECNASGRCTVGQMYVTTSGDTEIDVTFSNSARLSPYLGIAVDGEVEVDWGDNSTNDTITGSSLVTQILTQHSFPTSGDYTIKIHVNSGTLSLYGTGTYPLFSKNSSTASANYVYSNCIKAVRVGDNTEIRQCAFYYCYSLEYVTIPNNTVFTGNNIFGYCYSIVSVTLPKFTTTYTVGGNAFSNCVSLKSVSIPISIYSFGNSVFYYCYSLELLTIPSSITTFGTSICSNCLALESIIIPSAVSTINNSNFTYCSSMREATILSGATTINSSAFSNCHSLVSLTIPSTVTSIAASAFTSCYGMAEYHFKSTTPPTLANTNAFNNIQSDCVIYVPQNSLTTYQTANNWSTYSSYMQGELA